MFKGCRWMRVRLYTVASRPKSRPTPLQVFTFTHLRLSPYLNRRTLETASIEDVAPASQAQQDAGGLLMAGSDEYTRSATAQPILQPPERYEPERLATSTDRTIAQDWHAAEKGVNAFKTLEESLKGDTGRSVQSTFKLGSKHVASWLSRVVKRQETERYNKAKNSMLKEKGLWSYDWRIPLLEIRQHFQSDSSPLADLDTFTHPPILYRQFSAPEVFEPLQWSKESFADYVNDLAGSHVTRLMARNSYQGLTSHVEAVRHSLLSLFKDENLSPYFSTEAFENALRFYYRYPLVGNARTLFNIMLEQNIPVTQKTMNIALQAAAVKKDLHTFTYLLRVMIRFRLKPNEGTWVNLVVATESTAAKWAVVQNMRQLGLLQRQDVLQAIGAELISSELNRFAKSEDPVTSAIQSFDTQFTPAWFSSSAGSMICKYLCEGGDGHGALEFLDTMINRGCTPDRGTMDVLLTHYLMTLDAHAALGILKRFWSKYRIVAGEPSYYVLFSIAWERCLYNTCRVVWWKACIEAMTTYRMQELAMRSLLRNTPPSSRNLEKVWTKEIGKVMVGIGIEDGHEISIGNGSPLRSAAQELAVWASSGEERLNQLKLVNNAIAADLRAFQEYRLVEADFHEAFAKALEQDKNWRERGYADIPTMQKIREAIHIPIRRKVRTYETTPEVRKYEWEPKKVKPVNEAKRRDGSQPVKLQWDL